MAPVESFRKRILFQDLPPVRRLVDPALGVRGPYVPQRRDVDDVVVARVDADAADLLRGVEPHVLPRLAGVGALPHAVAVGHVAADRRLAAADVHDVGIALAHRDRADRAAEESVAHRLGGVAAVRGFPDAAAGGAHVVLVGPRHRAGHSRHAAGAVGADVAPPHVAEVRRIDVRHNDCRWRALGAGRQRRRQQEGGQHRDNAKAKAGHGTGRGTG